MAVNQIIDEIKTDVTDIVATNFIYTNTNEVPSDGDAALSYERGKEKKGKELETCVLYVDIRGSVEMSKKLGSSNMGKVYTSFIKSVIKAGRGHNGHTRNIIGDRVMIVFPRKECFTNAVGCTVSINHIASKVISPIIGVASFKCGIGIDFGTMRVIKVGVPRRGQEANPSRGLVWVGVPANVASRLTDRANKSISETMYDITYNPINPMAINPTGLLGIGAFMQPSFKYNPNQPFYLSSTATKTVTETEFAQMFVPYNSGDSYFTTGGKLITFNRREKITTYPPILMTEVVLNGLIAEKLKPSLYAPKASWIEEKDSIPNVSVRVYGGDYVWNL